jgi:hypothetical protein
MTQPPANMGVFVGELSRQRHAAMADILHDPELASQDQRAHEQTFHSFSKLVLFAILHIMLVLSCLALAFLGNAPLIALLAGVGGTVLLLALFATVI